MTFQRKKEPKGWRFKSLILSQNCRPLFKKYSLFVGLFVLGVIFWGAWVRLSLSGDGCGDSWPLCGQKLLPEGGGSKGWTEWIHRLSSGVAFLLVFSLWLFALKIYPKGHIVKKLSLIAFVLIIVEALIGAVLVIKGFVGLNTEGARLFILAFHLINSLLLTGVLALCFQSSFWDRIQIKKPHIYFIPFFIVLAMTGNIASLAGQLFPSESLFSALALDFMPSAHISLKLRPLHPLLACLFVVTLIGVCFSIKDLRSVAGAGLVTALFGFFTLVLLSPLWMKIGHLVLAYSFWIFLILISFKQGRFNLKPP